MARRTLDVCDFLEQEHLAKNIANKYQEWESFRDGWLNEKKELQEYIFATSTRNTTNATLPWKNSVHIPKLCQIRDNLHANYMSALFPNDNAIIWEGDDEGSESVDKRRVIESYMRNKLRMAQFRTEVSRLVYDWIDYGMCFAMPTFVAEYTTDPVTGEKLPAYIGPKAMRISPLDIVFDPTADNFMDTPKIVRSVHSLGGLAKMIETNPEDQYLQEVFDAVMEKRHQYRAMSRGDFSKDSDFSIQGFSGFLEYLGTDYVELLHFYGDIYDTDEKKLYSNYVITVVDRAKVIRKVQNPSWFSKPQIFSCGWRLRQDNLYAMGPLDNLVGMQHRIDHLENAKADAFDLIIHPVIKVKGFVEPFTYGPGQKIFTSEEGEVEFMNPDVTFLQADTQIALYEAKMEEMAGAPKQAMGFRTPGEKTAYEMQVLEQGANRVFLNKTSYFEEMFLEPLIASMLELSRRNLNEADTIRVLDEQTGAVIFSQIKKEDLTARGKIRPIGARHFAQNAQIVQNLTQTYAQVIQDPAVAAHWSGMKLSKALEYLLGLEKYGIVNENVRIMESAQQQQLVGASQNVMMQQQGGPPLPPEVMNGQPA